MVDLRVFKDIEIKSHKGPYKVYFDNNAISNIDNTLIENGVFIIDENVSILYKKELTKITENSRYLIIQASEDNKSITEFNLYIKKLVEMKIRRDQPLIAIGGGIIQDITCFLASTLMRGLPWVFIPTTLLAQADSCIGSKSSINSGDLKNILGTFTPPSKVIIDTRFLGTLPNNAILSGIGEMLKVHAIDSPESFTKISYHYDQLQKDDKIMQEFIYSSLLFKKRLIELDEFDRGPRNVMNYGHSFGHAIESATNFEIPHGIAVTIGMDIANFVALDMGILEQEDFDQMHQVLAKNSEVVKEISINLDKMIEAISKDKKNTASNLRLILPNKKRIITIGLYKNDAKFRNSIVKYIDTYRKN